MSYHLQIPAKRNALRIFFSLVFILSWPLWILSALARAGLLAFSFPATFGDLIGAWAPSLVGIFITLAMDKRRGLNLLLRRLLVWRVGGRWYLFVLLWPAILSLLSSAISMLLGGTLPDFSNPPFKTIYPLPPEAMQIGFLAFLPLVFIITFFSSPLGEEFGWRGFALPRLQGRRSAVLSSLILGLIWGLWHIPRQWTPGVPFDYAGFIWFLIGISLTSILYTWIFNNTQGSLLPVVLFHNAKAVTTLFLASNAFPWVDPILTALLVIWIIYRNGAAHLTRLPTAVARDILNS